MVEQEVEQFEDAAPAPQPTTGWTYESAHVDETQEAQPEAQETGYESSDTLDAEEAAELGLTPEERETNAYKKLNGKLSQRGQEVKDLKDMVARLEGRLDQLSRTPESQQEPDRREEDGNIASMLKFDPVEGLAFAEDSMFAGSEAEVLPAIDRLIEARIKSAVQQIEGYNQQVAVQQAEQERMKQAESTLGGWLKEVKDHPNLDGDKLKALNERENNLAQRSPKAFIALAKEELGITEATPEPKSAPQRQVAPHNVEPTPAMQSIPRHGRAKTSPAAGAVGRMDYGTAIDTAMNSILSGGT